MIKTSPPSLHIYGFSVTKLMLDHDWQRTDQDESWTQKALCDSSAVKTRRNAVLHPQKRSPAAKRSEPAGGITGAQRRKCSLLSFMSDQGFSAMRQMVTLCSSLRLSSLMSRIIQKQKRSSTGNRVNEEMQIVKWVFVVDVNHRGAWKEVCSSETSSFITMYPDFATEAAREHEGEISPFTSQEAHQSSSEDDDAVFVWMSVVPSGCGLFSLKQPSVSGGLCVELLMFVSWIIHEVFLGGELVEEWLLVLCPVR